MFFCIACTSPTYISFKCPTAHILDPRFHFTAPHHRSTFVNFTILNIHACFPFLLWMDGKGKKRQRMCVDVKVFPPSHLYPPSTSSFNNASRWGFHVLQKMGFNMYTYSFARMWSILQQQQLWKHKKKNRTNISVKFSLHPNTRKDFDWVYRRQLASWIPTQLCLENWKFSAIKRCGIAKTRIFLSLFNIQFSSCSHSTTFAFLPLVQFT